LTRLRTLDKHILKPPWMILLTGIVWRLLGAKIQSLTSQPTGHFVIIIIIIIIILLIHSILLTNCISWYDMIRKKSLMWTQKLSAISLI